MIPLGSSLYFFSGNAVFNNSEKTPNSRIRRNQLVVLTIVIKYDNFFDVWQSVNVCHNKLPQFLVFIEKGWAFQQHNHKNEAVNTAQEHFIDQMVLCFMKNYIGSAA